MKRSDLEHHLIDHGCEVVREGARHVIWQNPARDLRAPPATPRDPHWYRACALSAARRTPTYGAAVMRDLDLLPPGLRGESRMEGEIALPYPQVLEAIDVLEAADALLLGWEPLASYHDGRPGAYPAPGIGGLAGIEVPGAAVEWDAVVRESARIHRDTIEDEWQTRESTPPRPDVELIFCVTALTREQWEQERAL